MLFCYKLFSVEGFKIIGIRSLKMVSMPKRVGVKELKKIDCKVVNLYYRRFNVSKFTEWAV